MAEEDVPGGMAQEGGAGNGESADEWVAPEAVESLPELIRASDLEEEPPEPAELGFEPGNLYKGHAILTDLPVQDERHAYLFDPAQAPGGSVRAFYVRAKDRTIGLVPWAGSTVIWPWEKAWEQDLYHAQNTPEKIAFRKEYAKRMKGAK